VVRGINPLLVYGSFDVWETGTGEQVTEAITRASKGE